MKLKRSNTEAETETDLGFERRIEVSEVARVCEELGPAVVASASGFGVNFVEGIGIPVLMGIVMRFGGFNVHSDDYSILSGIRFVGV